MTKHSPEYDAYLKSDKWQQKREARMKIDGRCCMCLRPLNTINSIQTHHCNYKHLFDEDIYSDICTLCGTCHKRLHNYLNRIKSADDECVRARG